jgi:hypothetical protein
MGELDHDARGANDVKQELAVVSVLAVVQKIDHRVLKA